MPQLRELVEPDCGGQNKLVQFTSRLTNEASKSGQFSGGLPQASSSSSLADQFTSQYLHESAQRTPLPATISLHSLSNQLRTTDLHRNHALQQANQWSSEYQSKSSAAANRWAHEFAPSATKLTESAAFDNAWTAAAANSTAAMAMQIQPIDQKWSADYLQEFDAKPIVAAEKWANEYASENVLGSDQYEDYWAHLDKTYEAMAAEGKEDYDWLREYDDMNTALYKEYQLQEDNPYVDSADPLAEGKRLLAMGDLANAILHFEAAVQKNEQNSEAWQCLGVAQGENEQEASAIAALRRSQALDKDNLATLNALSVSYTNECLYNDAMYALADWLAAHPQYNVYASKLQNMKNTKRMFSFMDKDFFDELERSFLGAAASQPHVDADLQNSLGVLYNVSGNFDRAIDAFRAALAVKPEDARLWNRLGATLTNGGNADEHMAEVISAYSRALELYPAFVRARANLAVGCLRLRSYREALEHYITAMQLQQRGIGPTSNGVTDNVNMWYSMRTAALGDTAISENPQLKENVTQAIDNRDLNGLIRVLQSAGISHMGDSTI